MNDYYFVIIRSVSLLIVASLYLVLPRELYAHVYFGILFSHYTLAFVKARHRAAEVAMNPNAHLPLLILIALTAAYPFSDWPKVMFYFGFHHAANDAYMRFNLSPEGSRRLGHSSRHALFFSNLASYFIILRHDSTVNWIPLPFLITLYLVSAGIFWREVWVSRAHHNAQSFTEAFAFEFINLAVLILSLTIYMPVVGLDFVFYHLLLWVFIPLWRVEKARHSFNWRSLAVNLGLALLFFLLTPSAGFFDSISNDWLERQSNIWGFIHVSFTFAVSSLNPDLIRGLFIGAAPWLRAWR